MTSRPGRWNSYWVHRSPIGLPSGRSRVAKCSRCERLAAWEEPFDDGVGKVVGFSLHAGVAARADERNELELRGSGGEDATFRRDLEQGGWGAASRMGGLAGRSRAKWQGKYVLWRSQ